MVEPLWSDMKVPMSHARGLCEAGDREWLQARIMAERTLSGIKRYSLYRKACLETYPSSPPQASQASGFQHPQPALMPGAHVPCSESGLSQQQQQQQQQQQHRLLIPTQRGA